MAFTWLSSTTNTFMEFPLSIDRIFSRITESNTITPATPSEGAFPSLQAMNVLVVDDNHVNAMVATGYLRKLGIAPVVVDSGRKAVDLICREEQQFDLVLMDCEMPEMDGLEATRYIRNWERQRQRPHQPICALSAHALESYRHKCIDAGMDEFLAKPIVMQQLFSTLHQFHNDSPPN